MPVVRLLPIDERIAAGLATGAAELEATLGAGIGDSVESCETWCARRSP